MSHSPSDTTTDLATSDALDWETLSHAIFMHTHQVDRRALGKDAAVAKTRGVLAASIAILQGELGPEHVCIILDDERRALDRRRERDLATVRAS